MPPNADNAPLAPPMQAEQFCFLLGGETTAGVAWRAWYNVTEMGIDALNWSMRLLRGTSLFTEKSPSSVTISSG